MPRSVSWGITYSRMLVLPSQSVVVAVCSGIVGALLGVVLTFVAISMFPGCRIASRMQLAATVDEIPKSKSGRRKSRQEKKRRDTNESAVSSIFKEDILSLTSTDEAESLPIVDQEPSPVLLVSHHSSHEDDASVEAPLLSKSSSFTNISLSSITNGGSQNDEVAVSSEAELSDWVVATKKDRASSENFLKTKVTRMEEECEHYRESYLSLSKLYDELKKKSEVFDQEKRRISGEYVQKLGSLESDLAAVKNINSSLTNELVTLRQQSKEAERMPDLERKVQDFQLLVQQLNQKLEALREVESQNVEFKAKLGSFEVVAAEYESTKALLSAANASLESERLIRTQAENQFTLLENELASYRSNSVKNSDDLIAVRAEIEAASREKEALIQMNADLQQQITMLKEALEESMMSAAQNALEHEKSESRIAVLNDQLAKASASNGHEECTKEINQLNETLRIERAKFTKEMELTAHAMTSFKERLRENEAQLVQLKKALASSPSY